MIDPMPLEGAHLERRTVYFTFPGNYERVDFRCCKVPDGDEPHGETIEDREPPFQLRVDLGALADDSGLSRELDADLFTSATSFSSHTALWTLEARNTDTAIFDDGGTHTIDYTIPGKVSIQNDTTVNLVAGAVLMSGVDSHGDFGLQEPTLNIYGGEVYGRLLLIYPTTTNLYRGEITGEILNDSGELTIYGGWIRSLTGGGYGGGTIIHDGAVDEITIYNQPTEFHGGRIRQATFGGGSLVISGGTFAGPVNGFASWSCEITGADFQAGVTSNGESGCLIKGGQFGEPFVYRHRVGPYRTYGGFSFHGDLQLTEPAAIAENHYQSEITGTLADGSPLSQTIDCYVEGLATDFVGPVCDLVEIISD